ncbi:T9SS type A sorting domain-containing protein [Neolewinella lacunae]|uniref:T9SS type A sorting domain-containing protein n=1 Tax=Neolewinella lacunae TaxID=1517758 RepID=A0A923PHN1_9BACT|nr:T9SS type A sorting domain-containing protein [Neolewinella lacunae]MBC6994247.1 T9SS type A sorting domain-containing protein [Neolewinella lacunae]MDN3637135.1 T9SS type A sorting domain-containing protein [Neolewinella lacunae]
MQKSIIGLLCLFLLVAPVEGQSLLTYDWPTAEGEALLSDKYAITVSQGGATLVSQVIMSESKDIEIPNFAEEFKGGRTMNWTMFAANFSQPVTVSVTKLFGSGAPEVEVVPSPFGIVPTLSTDGRTATFTLEAADYVAVNFKSSDNRHTSDGVVKHMLMVFAEPPEANAPNPGDPGVVVYSDDSDPAVLNQAQTLYFPPGYHDTRTSYPNGGNLASFANRDNKNIYFAPGAYVHGRMYMQQGQVRNLRIFGRGVLTGRDYKWSKNLGNNGGVLGVDSFDPIEAHVGINGSNNTAEGIIVCDGAFHGVNMGNGNARYERVKTWAWHPNNDGFRPWGENNRVNHCFLHVCDDVFYNKGLLVTETVIWQGFNGAIITYGWDGAYNTENSVLRNNYIIYPQWRGRGNNNGLVASQLDYDMRGTNIIISGLHVDGNVPAIMNLHTNSGKADNNDFQLPPGGSLGFIDGLILRDVTITGEQVSFSGNGFNQTPFASQSDLRGAVLTNGQIFRVQNVTFCNVSVAGETIDEDNVDEFVDRDPATADAIRFCATNPTTSVPLQYAGFQVSPTPTWGTVHYSGLPGGERLTLTLFSATGQRIGNPVFDAPSSGTFDLGHLPAGVYFLRLSGQSGSLTRRVLRL